MTIRNEKPSDYDTILRLTYEAFVSMDYPGRQRMDEHFLISLLQGCEYVIPELCFVAERGGEIVGHILYTKSKILRPDGSATETITFGPLSVMPKYQRQGIGSALVYHSMNAARALGYGAVLITGVVDYYPKLGFARARKYNLTLEDGSSPDYFMAYELAPGYLGSTGGALHFCPPEFARSETDDAGYETFHRQFMRVHYPGQIILRLFWDADAALLERWFAELHVAQWFKHPDGWLHEAKNRCGEFSFIWHFIVEYEGEPIGFCQYYDAYYGQKYEEWYWYEKPECAGEVFSIDYLIGNPVYLHRGFGKEIVRQLTARVRKLPAAKAIVAEPESANHASRNVLLANGYVPKENNGHGYFALELETHSRRP